MELLSIGSVRQGVLIIEQKALIISTFILLAESEGFEPPEV